MRKSVRYFAALTVLTAFAWSSNSQKLSEHWQTNKNCEACHQDFSKNWETTRHSNSHYSKNDLFKKSLDYIITKNPTIISDEIKVKCAQCHNPKLAKRHLSDEEKVGLLFEDKDTQKEIRSLLDNPLMQNGINCIVCHTMDKIHIDKKKGSGGMESVTFGKEGTVYGPFDDADSPYHKSFKREHFATKGPGLCFVCHYSYKNAHGLDVYATGKEYDKFASSPDEGCKDCHMSEQYEGYATNYKQPGMTLKKRLIRKHRFASVDNSNIMLDYVDVKGRVKGNDFVLYLTNHAPHKIPTGYGLRQIILTVTFLDKKENVIEVQRKVLGVKWTDEEGEETIPHLAVKIAEDTRLEGKKRGAYRFKIPAGAVAARYRLSYRLVSETMAKKMGVSDPFFLHEYIFSEQRLHL
jgi:hypothetical protein